MYRLGFVQSVHQCLPFSLERMEKTRQRSIGADEGFVHQHGTVRIFTRLFRAFTSLDLWVSTWQEATVVVTVKRIFSDFHTKYQ